MNDLIKIQKPKRKRRCIPRGHVSTQTTMVISSDAWLLVCMHLEHSPHAVFRLMMTCKGTFSAFENASTEAWWVEFFEKIKRYQGSLKHSNFLKRLEHLQLHKLACRNVLRGIFAPRCDYCGTRFGHRLMQPFAIRTCAECLRLNAISNSVLELRYGLSFSDFLEKYVMEKGFLAPLDSFRFKIKALQCLSNDELDTRYVYYNQKKKKKAVQSNTLYFFWRPDIERILGLCLDKCMQQENKKKAVAVLSAFFKRHSDALLTVQAVSLFRHSDSLYFQGCCNEAKEKERAYVIDIKAWRALAQSMRTYNNNITDAAEKKLASSFHSKKNAYNAFNQNNTKKMQW